ncbi:MAG: hypothetical protein ABUL49_01300, partial [bacterium]
ASLLVKQAKALNLTGPTSLKSGATGQYTLRLNGKAGPSGSVYTIDAGGGSGPPNMTVAAQSVAVAFNIVAPNLAVGSTFIIKVTGSTGDTATIAVTITA